MRSSLCICWIRRGSLPQKLPWPFTYTVKEKGARNNSFAIKYKTWLYLSLLIKQKDTEERLLWRHPLTDTDPTNHGMILLLKIRAFWIPQNEEPVLPSLALTCEPWAIASHLSMLTSRTHTETSESKGFKMQWRIFLSQLKFKCFYSEFSRSSLTRWKFSRISL